MAKFLILCGLLLVSTFSRAAPMLDEELDDNDFDEKDDEVEDEREDEDNEEDYKSTNAKDDDYEDEINDVKRKEDEDEEDYSEDKDVEITVKQGDPRELNDDDDDTEESDDRIVEAAGKNIVEDSEGKMALEKITEDTADEDDDDNEGGDDDMDEADGGDMGQKISELKKIFNEDMPKEIEELKSSSKTLNDDLDNLNAKLDRFLSDNGIEQHPALPQSDEQNDYVYN